MGNTNQNATAADIEYGLHLQDNGTLEVLEGGVSRGSVGLYRTGDVLRVAVVSNGNGKGGPAVRYYRNDTLLYTSTVAPTYPLYMDTSFYTPGSKLRGAMLCSGSGCLGAPAYTSYYLFGGKLVGMRRANYPTAGGATNGQLRIVGDHLGSTTLVVDTATTPGPNVVQRQYHKPYGETAYQFTASSTGSQSLTNIGYTGQRSDEDSTGLLFYNARMYDPVLSFFVSADTVVSEASDPRSRNRYSYVMNNPVGYTDPTGHCRYSKGVSSEDDRRHCDETEDKYRRYGIELDGDWELWMLDRMLEAVEKMMEVANWDISDFKHAMGISDGGRLVFNYKKEPDAWATGLGGVPINNPAFTSRTWNTTTIEFHATAFSGTPLDTKGTVVHELAHAWDQANGDKLSRDFMQAVGSGYQWVVTACGYPARLCPDYRYFTGEEKPVRAYGNTNASEDFADSVAAAVYPESFPEANQPAIKAAKKRIGFVRDQFQRFGR